MQAYFTNKIISLGVVALCLVSAVVFLGDTPVQWQTVLLVAIVFGYAHYFLGAYYQLRGFARKEFPYRYYISFGVLSLLTIVIVQVFLQYFGFILILLIGVAYFLFHGLLNEQTLVSRQANLQVPLLFFTGIAVFCMTLLLYSMPHKTLFMSQDLTLQPINEFLIRVWFAEHHFPIEYFPFVLLGGVGVSLGLMLVAWKRYQYRLLAMSSVAVMTGISLLVWFFGSLPYIHVYLIIIGYHCMTWFLFFYTEFKKRDINLWRRYIIEHLILMVFFLVGAWFHLQQPSQENVFTWLFDFKIFLFVSYIHISTSFLNDAWLQKLQTSFFTKLGW